MGTLLMESVKKQNPGIMANDGFQSGYNYFKANVKFQNIVTVKEMSQMVKIYIRLFFKEHNANALGMAACILDLIKERGLKA